MFINNINPTLLQLGPFEIRYYGIIFALGFLITLFYLKWQVKKKNKLFCPSEYNDIGKFINKKIKAMEIYSDELKKYPHPRSKEGIRILAQYRGLEVGYKYAEAFQVIRQLKD